MNKNVPLDLVPVAIAKNNDAKNLFLIDVLSFIISPVLSNPSLYSKYIPVKEKALNKASLYLSCNYIADKNMLAGLNENIMQTDLLNRPSLNIRFVSFSKILTLAKNAIKLIKTPAIR